MVVTAEIMQSSMQLGLTASCLSCSTVEGNGDVITCSVASQRTLNSSTTCNTIYTNMSQSFHGDPCITPQLLLPVCSVPAVHNPTTTPTGMLCTGRA
jgi:hypothetical protein